MASGLRLIKVYYKKAMIGRGDNDTSAQSQVERDKTVASNEGSHRRTLWW